MVIGVDIDGILVDTDKFIRTVGKEYFGSIVLNNNAYDVADMFNVSMTRENDFWHDNIENYVKEYSLREYRRSFIPFMHSLIKMGHSWVIVTDRCKDLSYTDMTEDEMMFFTAQLIKTIVNDSRHIITDNFCGVFDMMPKNIYFTKGDKVKACKENDISIMIEDKSDHIEKLSQVMPVIKMNYNHNRYVDSLNSNILPIDEFSLELASKIEKLSLTGKW